MFYGIFNHDGDEATARLRQAASSEVNMEQAEPPLNTLSLLQMTYSTKGATSNYASAMVVLFCAVMLLVLDI